MPPNSRVSAWRSCGMPSREWTIFIDFLQGSGRPSQIEARLVRVRTPRYVSKELADIGLGSAARCPNHEQRRQLRATIRSLQEQCSEPSLRNNAHQQT